MIGSLTLQRPGGHQSVQREAELNKWLTGIHWNLQSCCNTNMCHSRALWDVYWRHAGVYCQPLFLVSSSAVTMLMQNLCFSLSTIKWAVTIKHRWVVCTLLKSCWQELCGPWHLGHWPLWAQKAMNFFFSNTLYDTFTLLKPCQLFYCDKNDIKPVQHTTFSPHKDINCCLLSEGRLVPEMCCVGKWAGLWLGACLGKPRSLPEIHPLVNTEPSKGRYVPILHHLSTVFARDLLKFSLMYSERYRGWLQ